MWLTSDAEQAWPYFIAHISREGKSAIEALSIFSVGAADRKCIKIWPPEKLADLAHILHQHYPEIGDPKDMPAGLISARGDGSG